MILIAGFLVLAAVSFSGMRHFGNGGRHVVGEAVGKRVLELSLDMDATETVKGSRGEAVIVVENGSVRIAESDCPHNYCVRMGNISRRGELIVCVPNRIIVTIKGGSERESIDGVTQ